MSWPIATLFHADAGVFHFNYDVSRGKLDTTQVCIRIKCVQSSDNVSRVAHLIILGLEYQVSLSDLGMGGLTSCTL